MEKISFAASVAILSSAILPHVAVRRATMSGPSVGVTPRMFPPAVTDLDGMFVGIGSRDSAQVTLASDCTEAREVFQAS